MKCKEAIKLHRKEHWQTKNLYLRAFKAIYRCQRSPLFRVSIVCFCLLWVCQLSWIKSWSHSLNVLIFCLLKNPIGAFLHSIKTSWFRWECKALWKVLLSRCLSWSCALQIWFNFGGRFSVLWSNTTFDTRFLTWFHKVNYLLYDMFEMTYLSLSIDILIYLIVYEKQLVTYEK